MTQQTTGMAPGEYREIRKAIGTQREVAAALGVHPQTISDRERGVLVVDDEAALAIRQLLTDRTEG